MQAPLIFVTGVALLGSIFLCCLHICSVPKLCGTAMANASKCRIKPCLNSLHTQCNKQDMLLHALCIRHPCVAALTLMANPIAQAHTDVRRLEFLPYHFLLGSVGDLGVLRFQVSIHHIYIPHLSIHTSPYNRLRLSTLTQPQLLSRSLAESQTAGWQ